VVRLTSTSGYKKGTPSLTRARIGCGIIAAINIPARWDVDRHDQQAGAGDEREFYSERSAHAARGA
jgi:hypothetical protein